MKQNEIVKFSVSAIILVSVIFIIGNNFNQNSNIDFEEVHERMQEVRTQDELEQLFKEASTSEKIHESCALFFQETIDNNEYLNYGNPEIPDLNEERLRVKICMDSAEQWKGLLSSEYKTYLESELNINTKNNKN